MVGKIKEDLHRAGPPDETNDSAHWIASVHEPVGVLLRTAVSTKARKRGWGATGRDLNSGWAWVDVDVGIELL
ncbi:MAG: hypothetical protein ACYTFI_25495, partial [Planctomycetota bacterium]